jgi:HK97 family phage prohead protease
VRTEAPFQLDFLLDGKAVIEETEDGIWIEGYASDFGLDRQDEAFESGAFEKGMAAFMENPVLLYHHQFDKALGQIKEFSMRSDGLWIKAWVDRPAESSPLLDVYRKIKSGTIRGFSVGGKFYRRVKGKIHRADLIEVSVTPTPVNPRTLFAVVGKAFGEDNELDRALADVLDEVGQSLGAVESALEARA